MQVPLVNMSSKVHRWKCASKQDEIKTTKLLLNCDKDVNVRGLLFYICIYRGLEDTSSLSCLTCLYISIHRGSWSKISSMLDCRPNKAMWHIIKYAQFQLIFANTVKHFMFNITQAYFTIQKYEKVNLHNSGQ